MAGAYVMFGWFKKKPLPTKTKVQIKQQIRAAFGPCKIECSDMKYWVPKRISFYFKLGKFMLKEWVKDKNDCDDDGIRFSAHFSGLGWSVGRVKIKTDNPMINHIVGICVTQEGVIIIDIRSRKKYKNPDIIWIRFP